MNNDTRKLTAKMVTEALDMLRKKEYEHKGNVFLLTEAQYTALFARLFAIDMYLSSPWVKTADRLPDDDEPVLVTYVGYTDNLPHNDAIAVYAHEKADNYEGAWYWQDSDGVDDNPVSVSITHWMPIPPLPKEQAEE